MRSVTTAAGFEEARRSSPLIGTVASAHAKGKPGRARARGSWYAETPPVVEALFDVEQFVGSVRDPACGRGTIAKVCMARGHRVVASDIADRGYGIVGWDFLGEPPAGLHEFPVDNVICNPPYQEDLIEQFLRRALAVSRRKVAFLLRWAWAEGIRRRWVWDATPLAAIHPFARRVCMPPAHLKRVKRKGGAVCFAWWIWDHAHPVGQPPIVTRIERELDQEQS